VLWSPWLNTVWRGNLYEYKSGLFADVMYSNNRPFREGALLFKEPAALEQVALLYQRYSRFDESSYSVANATYFNLQGASALRLGRYSVPLEDEVVLSVQRPLSSSEVNGYLNSPNAFKWAANAILQSGRTKQIRYGLLSNGERGGGGGVGSAFFKDAVHDIEYARLPEQGKLKNIFLDVSTADIAFAPDNASISELAGLELPMSIANSQFLLEALIQCILEQLPPRLRPQSGCAVLIGGHRRTYMNDLASDFLRRILGANGYVDITALDFDECDVRYVCLMSPRCVCLLLLFASKETTAHTSSFSSPTRSAASLQRAGLQPSPPCASFSQVTKTWAAWQGPLG